MISTCASARTGLAISMMVSWRRWTTSCSLLASCAAWRIRRVAPSSIPIALITWRFPTAVAEPSLAPRQRAGRPRQRCFREPVFDKPETQQEKHAEHAYHSQQGMHEEENAEEERRPERIEQGRAGAGLGELTQHRKIAIGFRCPRPVGMGAFEARGERCGMKFFFKPLAHPAQCGAAQCIEHAANHDGKRNDERQHQERSAAAARQHAIVDLKQIDGRREKKQIVAAAIRENESERPRAGPQRRLQRRLRW